MALILKAEGFNNITLCTTDFDFKMQIVAGNHGIKYSLVKDIKSMKFDCVIGNPPYQDSMNENTKNIWPDFLKMAMASVMYKGTVALITPRTWTTTSLYSEVFTKYNTIYLNIDECERHFPGVGSTFSYFVIENHEPREQPVTITNRQETFTIDRLPQYGLGNPDPLSLSIISKMLKHQEKFKMVTSSGYNTMKFTKKDDTVSKSESPAHPYKILHKTKHGKDEFFFSSILDTKIYNVPRVIVNIWVANYSKMVVSDTLLTCEQYRHFPVSTIEEANNLKRVLTSPLYSFLAKSLVSGGSHTNNSLSQFPKIDVTHDWSDTELFNHFDLTETEIDHITKGTKYKNEN